MKTVKLSVIPKCNICGVNPAKYDAPIYPQGSWAYVCGSPECESHITERGQQIGSIIVQAPPTKSQTGEVVRGKILTGMDDALYDAAIEVKCPVCGEVRAMEIDSIGYPCECGVRVEYRSLI